MGSKPGSVVALTILLERGWQVKYVVVPSRVSHPWVTGQTLEELAVANGIRVVAQKDLPIHESVDFVISYMFRDLVKLETISMAGRAALNFHAGPLPEYGGWAFYSKAILENASEYGCTCHYMDEGFDTGPLLKVRRFPINALEETAYSLEQKAQNEMIQLFLDFCQMAEKNEELPLEEQDKSKMRYMTQKEFEALKEIPSGADQEIIDRYARAFWYPPYTGAYFKVGAARVEVLPEIVKNHLAELLHADDLERLKNVTKNYEPESM
jgi:methionyl-tRNA formyltransferase